MQLRFAAGCARAAPLRAAASIAAAALLVAPAGSRADAEIGLGSSVFREAGGPLDMLVIVPTADISVDIGETVGVDVGWTADIVSGASVAVVDTPAQTVDAVSSATVVDTRHVFSGGLRLSEGATTLAGAYHYGFENDYRSHSFDVAARTELFERNTAFEISYARAFDKVCDGPDAEEAVMKARLETSDGCFEDADDRRDLDLAVQSFQAAWTQNWLPILSTQASVTAQLLNGFQANPYRAVVIGRTAPQEYHPDDRARYAVGLDARLWLRPLAGALQTKLRAYRDTWDIRSLSAELAYEQTVGDGLRVRGRGRYYTQTAAAFFSDDYVLQPRGQYFTGDRELSPMHTLLLGGQLSYTVPADDEGEVLGFLDALELTLKGDILKSSFEFHYDQVEVPNDTALLGSFGVRAGF